jgi:hypothetical protein
MKIKISRQHSELGEVFRSQRLPWIWLSFRVIFGLVGVMGLGFPRAIFASAEDPSPAIRVRVDNYTQAPRAVLSRAEQEADRILGTAGLRAIWLDCPAAHSAGVPQDPCQEPFKATDIALRVVSESAQDKFRDTVFGFAVPPVLATVYYEYPVRLAKRDDAEFELPVILGCVIAHEIGHLLLGSNSHSGSGIMQSRWERKQVRQAMTGALLFTPTQAKHIQMETRQRNSPKLPDAR